MASTDLFTVTLSIGIVLNLTELVILIRERKIKDPFKMVLLSLTIADFLTLFLAMIIAFAWIAYGIRMDYAFGLLYPSAIVSQFHIAIITLQRILAVSLPLQFKSLITSYRSFVALISVWVLTVSLSAVLFIFKKDLAVDIFIYLLFGCGVLLFISYNFIIYRVVKDRRKVNASRAASIQNRKLIAYSISVTIAFIVCNYPFAIRTIVNKGLNVQSIDISLESYLFFLNPVVDPIIYLLLHECNREGRKCCSLLFKNRIEDHQPILLSVYVPESNTTRGRSPIATNQIHCSYVSSKI